MLSPSLIMAEDEDVAKTRRRIYRMLTDVRRSSAGSAIVLNSTISQTRSDLVLLTSHRSVSISLSIDECPLCRRFLLVFQVGRMWSLVFFGGDYGQRMFSNVLVRFNIWRINLVMDIQSRVDSNLLQHQLFLLRETPSQRKNPLSCWWRWLRDKPGCIWYSSIWLHPAECLGSNISHVRGIRENDGLHTRIAVQSRRTRGAYLVSV